MTFVISLKVSELSVSSCVKNIVFEIFSYVFVWPLGGNQRELARAKAQKKLQDLNKGKKDDGLTAEQRKLR